MGVYFIRLLDKIIGVINYELRENLDKSYSDRTDFIPALRYNGIRKYLVMVECCVLKKSFTLDLEKLYR